MEAHYGDHLYGEDLNVLRLERMAAELLGKEAASFVVSGTFALRSNILNLEEDDFIVFFNS